MSKSCSRQLINYSYNQFKILSSLCSRQLISSSLCQVCAPVNIDSGRAPGFTAEWAVGVVGGCRLTEVWAVVDLLGRLILLQQCGRIHSARLRVADSPRVRVPAFLPQLSRASQNPPACTVWPPHDVPAQLLSGTHGLPEEFHSPHPCCAMRGGGCLPRILGLMYSESRKWPPCESHDVISIGKSVPMVPSLFLLSTQHWYVLMTIVASGTLMMFHALQSVQH